ncbi:MAG: MBL fold metallo-hydrolase [Solirubrobacteraceae bacterium]
MILRQITHDDLGCASYLVGDEKAGVAAIVDPKLDIAEYLRLARYLGVSIDHVLETHNHADHVSGHGRLAVATGARIHVHRLAEAEYEHEPFDDGWELVLGASGSARCTRPATAPSTRPSCSSTTPAMAVDPGRPSPVTRCSSATSPAPTSPWTSRRARATASPLCEAR